MNPASDLFLSVRQDESVDQDTARCVVRLITNCFISGGHITFSKVLSRLKRKSELTFDEIYLDDCNDDLDFGRITNLMSCEDVIYPFHLWTVTKFSKYVISKMIRSKSLC